MTDIHPVLMIGLDAADAALIDSMCEEGRLPVLRSLRERGYFGNLRSEATVFAGGVWPTFYTSRRVPWHGLYHNQVWRQEHMRAEFVDAAWMPERPFWEHLGEQGLRTTIIDVPMVLRKEHDLHRGIHLGGWGTHDLGARYSWPPGLWNTLETKFGSPGMPKEQWGSHTSQSLLVLRDRLLETTDQIGSLGEFLLQWKPWDLFLLVLGASHRGGHYLWDLSQIDHAGLAPSVRHTLEGALGEIYQACDAVVGRLVATVPASTKILVFAVHGMGPNSGWEDRCAEILSRIQLTRGETLKTGPLYTSKSKGIVRSLKHLAIKRLPAAVQDWLFAIPRLRERDWRSFRYFPLPMDHAGYVRVNLRGREPQGVVHAGSEYDDICRELTDAFFSFRDIETGEPIVARVYHLDELAPPQAPYRMRLPDLVVVWGERSAIKSPGIRSDRYGEIQWDGGGVLQSGRSGNHRDGGWLIAVGPDIPSGVRGNENHIVDVASTVLRWLGAEPDPGCQGSPITAIVS